MVTLLSPAVDAPRGRGPAGRLANRLRAALDRLALAFRPFLAFAALAFFGFFMGILLNEGLRGFTKTG
ncbi:hypothetical protein I3J27_31500 [Bradyrhizobium xenonodulans]|uniref:ABC transporter permease n=1 Tax=Bradyrhizobium xenonodulans TaxID=2736875 RepID=A0ABY7N211_9BRAD|nr:hypothetical protein [Bradyrhizobium xenonodulans]WBL82847.1 hypothetical protein I3J27_31500 [Bradyrhizobium xenonodulans]